MDVIDCNHPLSPFLRVVDLSTGEDIENVLRTDPDAGWVERYALDMRGGIVVDDGGAPVVQRVEGLRLRVDVEKNPGQRVPLAQYAGPVEGSDSPELIAHYEKTFADQADKAGLKPVEPAPELIVPLQRNKDGAFTPAKARAAKKRREVEEDPMGSI